MNEYAKLYNNMITFNPLSTLVILPLLFPPAMPIAWLPINGRRLDSGCKPDH